MRKLFSVTLAVMLVLGLLSGLVLAGCGEEETTTTAGGPATSASAPATSGPSTTAAGPSESASSTETTAASGGGGAKYYLRWAQFAAAHLADSQPITKMAENVAARTNGQCKIEVFWSDSLVPMFEVLDAVRQGSAEMGTMPIGAFGGQDPLFACSEMPLYYNTIEAMIEGQAALAPTYDKVYEEKFNQKVIMIRPIIPLNVGSAKRPIKTLADWKGLMVQTISPTTSGIVERLGGSTAPASPIDVYELLQRGTVDATVQSLGKFVEVKLWEVCKYLTNSMLCSASAAGTINLDVWNKLPKDIQDVILDEAAKAQAEIEQISRETYYSYLDTLSKNMEVYNLPKDERAKWQEAVKPIIDGQLSKIGDLAKEVVRTAEEANAKYPYPY